MSKLTIADYDVFDFSALAGRHDVTHTVYHNGEGSPVVLIQELPGIGQATLRLAEKLIAAGHTVFMPHLFGPIGKVSMVGNIARVFCMRREFSLFSARKSSPIVDWLRALCQQVKADTGAKGVGVIGMCLTGNFAITLIADDSVLAAVSSQPAMPLGKQGALHMSDEEIEQVKLALDHKAPAKVYRFEGDKLSTAEKYACLHETFNQDKERIELNVLPGDAHSVLTLDFVDEEGHPTYQALEEIKAYFRAEL